MIAQGVAARMAWARSDLIQRLDRLDEAGRLDLMFEACVETGGSFIPHSPAPGDATFAEIDCLGIYHSGDDMPEAIAGWIKAVRRTLTTSEEAAA
ncbi:hypothetical protein [Roseicyclus sp.]|uniref:hypothetical protein n=1 Tax=Roseicyclus sp. TaxID=1914329 RepID=UPI003F6BA890